MKEKLNEYIKHIDHSFALSNYDYIINQVRDERIKAVYRQLGPYDHFKDGNDSDGEEASTRDF